MNSENNVDELVKGRLDVTMSPSNDANDFGRASFQAPGSQYRGNLSDLRRSGFGRSGYAYYRVVPEMIHNFHHVREAGGSEHEYFICTSPRVIFRCSYLIKGYRRPHPLSKITPVYCTNALDTTTRPFDFGTYLMTQTIILPHIHTLSAIKIATNNTVP